MAEWSKAHAWKVCIRQRIEGSNPSPSANTLFHFFSSHSSQLIFLYKSSLWGGGSNLPENLEVLCSDCHSKEHKFNFKSGESRDIKGYGDKPLLIEEAIKKGKKISFRYRKFDERKSKTRAIKPESFKQVEATGKNKFSLCVQGHWDLRQANRVFALRRMSKLRIVDK